ncbi:hypothetical protein [Ketobacter sp.]
MNSYKSLFRLCLTLLLTAGVVACVATSAKWMSYVQVNPDSLNEVLISPDNNVVHVSGQSDGIHITYYDETGSVSEDIATGIAHGAYSNTLNLADNRLLLVKSTLADSLLIDTAQGTVSPLDGAVVSSELGARTLSGTSLVLDGKVAAFGSTANQGWVLLMDFSAGSSELLEITSATAVSRVFGHSMLVIAVQTESGRTVVSFDAALNELSRFPIPVASENLIGESLGRPVLFHSSNHNVRATDVAGLTQWEFVNDEFEYIKGQSVGKDGRVLLWGDNASLNPLSGVRFDQAHFLLIDTTGSLLYHYLSGGEMANILYRNTHQFENGLIQVSFQGWTGQLAGFVIGSNLSTPFTVTRQVFHDFVTLKGSKTRWMREPKRIETYSQCGTLCVSLADDAEGHCDNLDIFNINSSSLVSVSQVCGAKNANGANSPNTVKVVRY